MDRENIIKIEDTPLSISVSYYCSAVRGAAAFPLY